MVPLRKTELSGYKDVPRFARLGKDLAERPSGQQRARNGQQALPGLLIPLRSESESDSVGADKRRHSAEIKFRAVLDVMNGRQTPAQVAKVYQVRLPVLEMWKDRFLECGAELFKREFPDQGPPNVKGERVRTRAFDAASSPPDNQRGTAEGLYDISTLSALLKRQAD